MKRVFYLYLALFLPLVCAVDLRAEDPHDSGPDTSEDTLWSDLSPRNIADFAAEHPDIDEQLEERWNNATAADQRDRIESDKRFTRESFKKKWKEASPKAKSAFVDHHPKIREEMKKRWSKAGEARRRRFMRGERLRASRLKKYRAGKRDRARQEGEPFKHDHGKDRKK